MAAAVYEPDGVTEIEVRPGGTAGRQVDDLDHARMQLDLRRRRCALEPQATGAVTRSDAGRKDETAQWQKDVVGQVSQEPTPFLLVLDGPKRAEKAGLVDCEVAHAEPTNQVGQGQGHHRRR